MDITLCKGKDQTENGQNTSILILFYSLIHTLVGIFWPKLLKNIYNS